MKFETVQFHFWSAVVGLLSPRNFATMATWHNDFASLFDGIITVLKNVWFKTLQFSFEEKDSEFSD